MTPRRSRSCAVSRSASAASCACRRVAPQDRGAALGRDHRINRVLEHQNGVAGGECDRAARAALADDRGHQRNPDVEAGLDRAGDRLALAARLGIDPGIGAGGVDKGQHRQPEPLGEPHQPPRLAIAFRARHAEIVLDARLGVGPLLGAEHDDAAAAKPADAADHRRILGEGAVAGERHELVDQPGDVVEAVRPLGMARDLHLLPRRQLRIALAAAAGWPALRAARPPRRC